MCKRRRGSVETLGGVNQPSVDVLTHCGEHHTEEPAVTTSSAGETQAEVVLLALDRTFGTRAALGVAAPEVAIPGDKGVQAKVLLRIGVDDPSIRRSGTVEAKVRARSNRWCLLGGSQRTTPFDAQAVGAEAPAFHRILGQANGNTLLQA